MTMTVQAQMTEHHPAENPRPSRGWRLVMAATLLRERLKDRVIFESSAYRIAAGMLGYGASLVLSLLGRRDLVFKLLAKLHRADYWGPANRRAAALARRGAIGVDRRVAGYFDSNVRDLEPTPTTAKFFEKPSRLLNGLIIVLKSPTDGEKGVINLRFSYIYDAFNRLFNVPAIAERYHIVLEPSWNGYCDSSILSFTRYPFPVFVQTAEPRDAEFLEQLNSNLVAIPGGANWWIDHRLFVPDPSAGKDFDVVMNARWAKYKRHAHFFDALLRLRRRGHRLRTLLLGYVGDLAKDDIWDMATYYGVADQIEVHDSVPYDRVAASLRRAKVQVVWSRKEGTNRAMIEGMLLGVPCVLREGFNYGHRYEYINARTGCYASDADLPDKLIWAIERHDQFSPREWVLDRMTPRRMTDVMSAKIGEVAVARGERWTTPLAVKVARRTGMEYWDPRDADRFTKDYEFLNRTIDTDR